jgi:hypothetical protein
VGLVELVPPIGGRPLPHHDEVRIACDFGKSLFSGRIKMQGVKKIKNTENRGFSQGVIRRESKNDGRFKIKNP